MICRLIRKTLKAKTSKDIEAVMLKAQWAYRHARRKDDMIDSEEYDTLMRLIDRLCDLQGITKEGVA